MEAERGEVTPLIYLSRPGTGTVHTEVNERAFCRGAGSR